MRLSFEVRKQKPRRKLDVGGKWLFTPFRKRDISRLSKRLLQIPGVKIKIKPFPTLLGYGDESYCKKVLVEVQGSFNPAEIYQQVTRDNLRTAPQEPYCFFVSDTNLEVK